MRSKSRAALVVALWAVAMTLGFLSMPRLHAVAVTDPEEFFPADSRHRASTAEIERLFPGAAPYSQIVLIVEGERGPVAGELVSAIAEKLRSLPSSDLVTAVHWPAENPVAQKKLTSADGRTALVVLQLKTGFGSTDGARVVAEVEDVARSYEAPGLRIFLSGDATLGRDYDRAIDQGSERSALATVFLVVLILLIVYRSPVAVGVSLVALAAALGVSFGLVTLAASLGLNVAYHARSFLVAIVYGVGTDYALLLFARVREEYAARTPDPIYAARRAALPVIAGSAVAVGLACTLMSFADFGLFRFSGIALAIGVMVSLAAILSLAPALMELVGPKLFWPRQPDAVSVGRVWPFIARFVLARPVVTLLSIALILSPLVVSGFRARPVFDTEGDIPRGSVSEAGFAALTSNFSYAAISPLALVIEIDSSAENPFHGWRDPDGLAGVHALTEHIASTPGVVSVYSAARPTGEAGLLERGTMRSQITEIESGLVRARTGALAIGGGLHNAQQGIMRGLKEIEAQQAEINADLQNSFAVLLAGDRFDKASSDLEKFHKDLEKLRAGLEQAEMGSRKIASGLGLGIDRLQLMTSSPASAAALDRLIFAPGEIERVPELDRALDHYVSGNSALFEIEGEHSPNSPAAVKMLKDLAARLPIILDLQGFRNATVHLGGATPITADLEEITNRDLQRIGLLVVAGVFLLLVVLLRDLPLSAAVTVYLLASYYASLGILSLGVRAGFWHGIDWKAPFFLFVLLVAIGADYGIFLLGRAREEAARSSFREGLMQAMILTGPVVSSCGLVLAGTFAALALTPISFLQQVGLGVTAGVLLDTLLIRPFLLPSTALLLRKFSGSVEEAPR